MEELQAHYDEVGKYLSGTALDSLQVQEHDLVMRRIASCTMTELLETTEDLCHEIERRKQLKTISDFSRYSLIRPDLPADRNLGRQRLSALPMTWFKTFCNEIHIELTRRFPELNDERRRYLNLTAIIVDFPFPVPNSPSESNGDVECASRFDRLSQFILGYETTPDDAARRGRLAAMGTFQFDELTIDVLDEITRREMGLRDATHLQAESAMHPRRNQARMDLSQLTEARLKALASDVQSEIYRRYLTSEDLVQELVTPP
ncbi:hypothetical protein BDN72DRAFT_846605 [Pluteus cervinus]|uniref:Uncharacterized protein n=1 Tax=Pluteus cervinus TaxID=181527 RepID=A0ACD3AG85_9AGAR|nr:hypothetical protein BDN72DRAFT_846605 [Pluteus cervinus]